MCACTQKVPMALASGSRPGGRRRRPRRGAGTARRGRRRHRGSRARGAPRHPSTPWSRRVRRTPGRSGAARHADGPAARCRPPRRPRSRRPPRPDRRSPGPTRRAPTPRTAAGRGVPTPTATMPPAGVCRRPPRRRRGAPSAPRRRRVASHPERSRAPRPRRGRARPGAARRAAIAPACSVDAPRTRTRRPGRVDPGVGPRRPPRPGPGRQHSPSSRRAPYRPGR